MGARIGRKELRGDRGYMGKFPGKVYERERSENLRSANYRGIIKSIPLFTTLFRRPTAIPASVVLGWTTRCDSLTIR